MYPDLSYVFHDLFGTQADNWTSIFKTFGLFLVLAILSSAYLLYLELRRKAKEGLFQPVKEWVVKDKAPSVADQLSNALFGFLLGFKVGYILRNFPEFQHDPSGVLLSGKGVWWAGFAAAMVFGGYSAWQAYKKRKEPPVKNEVEIYPHQRVPTITMIAGVAGVVGAKFFDILEHLHDFVADPVGTFFSGSGLAIYGGLITGFIAVAIYLRWRKIPLLHVMDAVAPALIIGYAVGRLGCHFSGDGDWGIAHTATVPGWWFLPDWVWAYDYPRNVLREGIPLENCTGFYCRRLQQPVYPTPFYEFVMASAIGGMLWGLRKRVTIPGMLFFIYLILNGAERLLIESIRINRRYDVLGLNVTQAEMIAAALILTGVVGCAVLWKFRGTAMPK